SPLRNAGIAAFLPSDFADLDGDGDTTKPVPLDLDDNPRVRDGAPDIGAYEEQNLTPTAGSLTVSTSVNTPVSFVLPGADADGDAIAFFIQNGPQHGTLSGDFYGPNRTYTPGAGFSGTDGFTYVVYDTNGYSAVGSVTISVNNSPPIANAQSVTTNQETPV